MSSVKSLQAFATTISSKEIGFCPCRSNEGVMMFRKMQGFIFVGNQMNVTKSYPATMKS